MDEIKAKQQAVEKIKESSKVLVTVSDDPSVDALSAALALTLLMDKQEKYATAIFSGQTPPAIAFLEPEKTFDDTTDSLRDFIIALNKDKADHLRYKVEGDSVKIFITPYKTTIDQSDLEFSQGDYNVELVIALGVDNQDHLDKALENHGKILHDATIITITAGDTTSNLGGIDWHDGSASSLSEMVAGLAEALKQDKKKSLIDAPIATALLTGIVAETDRFSNEHTTSRVMTLAATLMSAGADQQLIATELQTARAVESDSNEDTLDTEASSDDNDDSAVVIDASSDDGSMTIQDHDDPTSLAITHEGETLAELDRRVMGNEKAKEKVTEEVEAAEQNAADEEAKNAAEAALVSARQQNTSNIVSEPVANTEETVTEEPLLGGTLNATTEQAAEDARMALENDQNKTLLSHAYLPGDTNNDSSKTTSSIRTDESSSGFPGTPPVAPGSVGVKELDVSEPQTPHSAYALDDESLNQPEQPTMMSTSGNRVIQPISEAYQASNVPNSVPSPTDLGLPLPPPIPDFSQVNGSVAPAIPLPPTPQPGILGDILAPEPAAPIDYTANAVPSANTAYAYEEVAPPKPTAQGSTNDPGQFQIPSQP